MDPIYDVRGSPPTYHHQIIFFSDKEVTIAIKNIFYIKAVLMFFCQVNFYGLMDKTRDCGSIPYKDPIILSF